MSFIFVFHVAMLTTFRPLDMRRGVTLNNRNETEQNRKEQNGTERNRTERNEMKRETTYSRRAPHISLRRRPLTRLPKPLAIGPNIIPQKSRSSTKMHWCTKPPKTRCTPMQQARGELFDSICAKGRYYEVLVPPPFLLVPITSGMYCYVY